MSRKITVGITIEFTKEDADEIIELLRELLDHTWQDSDTEVFGEDQEGYHLLATYAYPLATPSGPFNLRSL